MRRPRCRGGTSRGLNGLSTLFGGTTTPCRLRPWLPPLPLCRCASPWGEAPAAAPSPAPLAAPEARPASPCGRGCCACASAVAGATSRRRRRRGRDAAGEVLGPRWWWWCCCCLWRWWSLCKLGCGASTSPLPLSRRTWPRRTMGRLTRRGADGGASGSSTGCSEGVRKSRCT